MSELIVLAVMVLLWFMHVTVVLQILQTLLQNPLGNSLRPTSEVRQIMAAPRLTPVHTLLLRIRVVLLMMLLMG